jgi:3-oxoacyl-[acyl-carrier-protein] synthase II
MKRIFVTGLGVVAPNGIGIQAFEDALKAGTSGVKPITCFDPGKHSVRIAAEVSGFDPSPFIPKKEIRRHDRYSQFTVAAAHMAITQAGISAQNMDPRRVGVIVATGIGGIHTFEEEKEVCMTSGPGRVSPFLVPMMICNIASGYVSMYHGFKGPNFTVVSACASAMHAIGESYLKLYHGYCDAVVTGGAEAAITPLTVAGFAQMKALSTRNDAPTEASRPWDKDRDGFVMGEGAGCLVLETEESMNKRGATPLAEILGYGASADAYHLTAPDPEGNGAIAAMTGALAFNHVAADKVGYINAHGTSTPLGDKAETNAVKKMFGDHSRKILMNSTKSMVGHLLGAAGAVGTIATILQMKDRFIHPTINLHEPSEGCDLDYVPNIAREGNIEYGLVNSFGFGGQNGSLLLKRI